MIRISQGTQVALGRTLDYLVALTVILILNFLLLRLLPGDPLAAIYGQEVLVSLDPAQQAQLLRQWGLDASLAQQLLAYLRR